MATQPQPQSQPEAEEECPIKTRLVNRATVAQEEMSSLHGMPKNGLRADKDSLRQARNRRLICMADLRDHIENHGC